jgi:hypothetical protein
MQHNIVTIQSLYLGPIFHILLKETLQLVLPSWLGSEFITLSPRFKFSQSKIGFLHFPRNSRTYKKIHFFSNHRKLQEIFNEVDNRANRVELHAILNFNQVYMIHVELSAHVTTTDLIKVTRDVSKAYAMLEYHISTPNYIYTQISTSRK